MAKAAKTIYVCSQCGYESPKWYGRCPECGEWNTFSEEMRQAPAKAPSASVPLGSVAPAGYNPNDIMKVVVRKARGNFLLRILLFACAECI